jgi:hypothetical protein
VFNFRKFSYVIFFILISILASLHNLNAQTSNILRLGFRQDFNNYVWDTSYLYLSPVQNKHQFRISESYRTNLLKTSSQTDKWKDDNQFQLEYFYPIKPWLKTAFLLESTIYSDRQSGFFNNYDTHSLNLGFVGTPKNRLQIKGYLGLKSDERYEKRSNGFHYQIQSFSEPFQLSDYTNQFNLDFRGDEFRGRNNQDLLFRYDIKREFHKNTYDSLSYQLGYRKNIYFISQDGNLESRIERGNNFSNLLNYQINDKLSWRLLTLIFSKSSSVDQIISNASTGTRKRQDTGILWESYVNWQARRIKTRIGYIYNSQNQEFQTSKSVQISPTIGSLGIPDNGSKTNSLRFYSGLQLSRKDSLFARFFVSRFQYDTPDSNNFDDRDEFRTTAILGYSHQFSPSLQIGFEALTNLHHLVYIFNERSANNKWNRILQLGTKIKYSPNQNVLWKQRAQVLANYTNFDFEEEQTQIRSFVFRKFTLTDSLLLGSLNNIQIQLFHRLELEENGRLFWNDFAEELLLNRQNNFLTFGIQFPLIGNLFLYNGISGYFRNEWRYKQNIPGKTIKKKQGDFISYGPQIKLFLLNNYRQNAFVSISRFRVKTPADQIYFINQIDLRANWFF